jgi:hypothetical protein
MGGCTECCIGGIAGETIVKFAGSWTIACDVAGRVTRQVTGSALITVAAVAVPGEVRDELRRRLVHRFDGQPGKWSAGGLDGLSRIMPLVSSTRFQF